ncbi:MAG: tail fiber protein [Gemmatimonadaceae bacterium]|nr:tail fiber protein [Gemmatimonadaceae bacterium]
MLRHIGGRHLARAHVARGLLARTHLALALTIALPPLAAQVTVPQVKDNRQPSLGLTHFIDADGFVRITASSWVPEGWARLDGGIIAAASAPRYTATVGATWGGNGTTTVGLPDAIGRTIAGAGGGLVAGTVHGSPTMTITTPNLPVSQGGSAQPIENRQQGLTMRYVVRTAGIFPQPDRVLEFGLNQIGAVAAFTGSVLPPGWAYAEGQVLNIATNQALYAVVGNTYGGSLAQGTFALPDLRGRVPIGVSGTAPLGTQAGGAQVVLTEANVPPALGGGGAPFTNMEPTLALHFGIQRTGQFYINGEGRCPCEQLDFEGAPFIGEINMFAGLFAPMLPTSGQLLSISDNLLLYALIGNEYGGDGVTTFALPDLGGRVVVGAGESVQDPLRTLARGARVGVAEHVLQGQALVPEPSTYALLATGLVGLGVLSRKRAMPRC